MYRILRKLVEFGFLIKNVDNQNNRFSIFCETIKLNELRNLDEKTYETSKMKLEELKLNSEILFLEKQSEKYAKLEQAFPSMKNKISHAKETCLSQLIEIKAYQSALKSVTALN
ncbi:hypothetical protein [Acinetobacter sp. TTH0-4]|uniref:hypothetical protein n=1 Tax=Acinetobacter sp. TTH0-4 TaxID=1646498 RepID=UPI0009D64845|nr:hypothetical protein [Acinetobacter sp. TTH0-4]